MRALMVVPLLIAAAAFGCVTENPTVEVDVDANSPKDELHLTREIALCFSEHSTGKEIAKARLDEAVRICTAVAKVKGLTVIKYAPGADCVMTEVIPHDDHIELNFYAPKKNTAHDVVHTVRAEMENKEAASPSRATVALCRAAFQAYPDDLAATKSYNTGTDLPNVALRRSEHCIFADTYFWEIEREVCTTVDKQICPRFYDRETQPADCHAHKS